MAIGMKSPRADYFCNMAEEHKQEPGKLWNHLNATGYIQNTKKYSATVLDIDVETCHDKVKVVNYFDTFFTNIAKARARDFELTVKKYKTNTSTFHSYCNNKGILSKGFIMVTNYHDFTMGESKKLKAKKNTGLD